MASTVRVAILVYDYFEALELFEPLHFLSSKGVTVDVVGVNSIALTPLILIEPQKPIEADILIKDANTSDYDVLILPGGVFNADALRTHPEAKRWALDFMKQNKLIAASGHAPWLLVSADIVEEKQLTSALSLRDDITNAGGEWSRQSLVIDQNLITSRGTSESTQFCESITNWLALNKAVL